MSESDEKKSENTRDIRTVPQIIRSVATQLHNVGSRSTGTSLADVWKISIGAERDQELISGISIFSSHLLKAESMIHALEDHDSEVKNEMLEPITGLKNIVDVKMMNSSYGNFTNFTNSSALRSMVFFHHAVKNMSSVPVPTKESAELIKQKILEIREVLGNSHFDVSFKEIIIVDLENLERSLKMSILLGGELVISPVSHIVGTIMVAKANQGHVFGSVQNFSEDMSSLTTLSLKLLELAGQVSFSWDATKYVGGAISQVVMPLLSAAP